MGYEAYPHVQVSGGPFERGFQHGAAAGDRIRLFRDRLIDDLRRSATRERPITREVVLEKAMLFLAPYEAYAPHLVEELRGIAAGARVSLAEALLCNVRGELARYLSGAATAPAEGCTAFAVGRGATAARDVLAGQNADLSPWTRDVAIVLSIKPDRGPAILMFTPAGGIGYHGFNEAGVCQFANALPPARWRPGLPHYPMKRLLLEQATVDGCLDLLRRARVASAGNYVVADRSGRALDVELTPDGCETIEQTDDVVVHANHYAHPRLAPLNPAAERLALSTCRSARLGEVLRTQHGRIDVETLKRALSDHAGTPATICGHDPGYLTTVASLIAEPDQGRLHVSFGNPCTAGYAVYSLP